MQQFRRDYFWRQLSPEQSYQLRVAMAVCGFSRLNKVPVNAPEALYDEGCNLVSECPYLGEYIVIVGLFQHDAGQRDGTTEYRIYPAKWISPEYGYKPISCYTTKPRGMHLVEWKFAFTCWKGQKGLLSKEPCFFGPDSDKD